MRKPKAHSPVSLEDVLPQVFNSLRPEAKPTQEMIQGIWERLVGKEAAQHSWPRTLKGGRLLVEVENSGWMYTLRLKKTPVLEGLIELLGASRVRMLGFRMGERRDA